MTRTLEVREVLEGLRRDKPPQIETPYGEKELRLMFATLGDAPLDVRDHLYGLLIYLGPLNPRTVRGADLAGCSLKSDGLLCVVDGHEWFVDAMDDPELDVRI